jgi:hypothetical protein
MKLLKLAICWLAANCIWAGSSATAQTQLATSVSTSSDYVCVQRSPHERVWRRPVFQTNQSGVVKTNFQSYTERATGICFPQNGEYVDSVEEISPVAGGAHASVMQACTRKCQSSLFKVVDNREVSSSLFLCFVD